MLIAIRVITWSIWMFHFLSAMLFIPALNHVAQNPVYFSDIHLLESLESNYRIVLLSLLIAIAGLEIWLTFFLKNFFIIKPFINNRFEIETVTGATRFVVIHVTIWIIAFCQAIGGMVFAIITKQIWWAYLSLAASILLFLLHAPRITPYKPKHLE